MTLEKQKLKTNPSSAIGMLVAAFLLSSCGTEVSVGRNSDPRFFDVESDEFLTDSTDDESTGGNGSEDAVGLSCFGISAEDEVPEYITDFCANTPKAISGQFKKITDTLCSERRLVQLTQPSCGWDGASELGAHLKVLEKTDLDDTATKDFDFFAAGSVTLPRTAEDYLWAFYKGYEDPEFRSRLKIYDKVDLSNLAVDQNAGTIDYTVEIKTSAATVGFTGHIDVVKYESGLIAVFDNAVKDMRIVKENRFLTLIAPSVEGEIVVVIIDQKKVDDLGNHRIAYSSSISFDKERMELMHAMAVTDEQADR